MPLQRFNPNIRIVQPNWLNEQLHSELMIPGGAKLVPTAFPVNDGTKVKLTAAAAAAATSITVEALENAVPTGTMLRFAAGKFAYTTATAAKGATAITVEALPVALAIGDTGYTGTKRFVQQGTLIGRTYAERDAGTGFGPWASGDDEVYLTVFDIIDTAEIDDVDLLRRNVLIKENWIPDWATLSAGAKAAIRANYQTSLGV